jgi:hypothetical protein
VWAFWHLSRFERSAALAFATLALGIAFFAFFFGLVAACGRL